MQTKQLAALLRGEEIKVDHPATIARIDRFLVAERLDRDAAGNVIISKRFNELQSEISGKDCYSYKLRR